MAERTYDSRSSALDAATGRTPRVAASLTQSIIRSFLDRADVVEERSQEMPLPSQLQPALVGHFAIRNGELLNINNFLELLVAGSKLAVGIATINRMEGAATAADALHSIYKLYRKIIGHGFQLSDEQLVVIKTLKDLKSSATSSDVARRITQTVDPTTVEAILAAFEITKCRPMGFTVRDDQGRWTVTEL